MTEHAKTTWANPSPAGTISLGFAIMMFFALLTGKVPSEAHMVAGIWLLGTFVIQVCVGLIELNMGADIGGNIYLWFGSYFCLATGLVFIFEYFAHIYVLLPIPFKKMYPVISGNISNSHSFVLNV